LTTTLVTSRTTRATILCCRDQSLERLTGSDPFFYIFATFQAVAEDGAVREQAI